MTSSSLSSSSPVGTRIDTPSYHQQLMDGPLKDSVVAMLLLGGKHERGVVSPQTQQQPQKHQKHQKQQQQQQQQEQQQHQKHRHHQAQSQQKQQHHRQQHEVQQRQQHEVQQQRQSRLSAPPPIDLSNKIKCRATHSSNPSDMKLEKDDADLEATSYIMGEKLRALLQSETQALLRVRDDNVDLPAAASSFDEDRKWLQSRCMFCPYVVPGMSSKTSSERINNLLSHYRHHEETIDPEHSPEILNSLYNHYHLLPNNHSRSKRSASYTSVTSNYRSNRLTSSPISSSSCCNQRVPYGTTIDVRTRSFSSPVIVHSDETSFPALLPRVQTPSAADSGSTTSSQSSDGMAVLRTLLLAPSLRPVAAAHVSNTSTNQRRLCSKTRVGSWSSDSTGAASINGKDREGSGPTGGEVTASGVGASRFERSETAGLSSYNSVAAIVLIKQEPVDEFMTTRHSSRGPFVEHSPSTPRSQEKKESASGHCHSAPSALSTSSRGLAGNSSSIISDGQDTLVKRHCRGSLSPKRKSVIQRSSIQIMNADDTDILVDGSKEICIPTRDCVRYQVASPSYSALNTKKHSTTDTTYASEHVCQTTSDEQCKDGSVDFKSADDNETELLTCVMTSQLPSDTVASANDDAAADIEADYWRQKRFGKFRGSVSKSVKVAGATAPMNCCDNRQAGGSVSENLNYRYLGHCGIVDNDGGCSSETKRTRKEDFSNCTSKSSMVIPTMSSHIESSDVNSSMDGEYLSMETTTESDVVNRISESGDITIEEGQLAHARSKSSSSSGNTMKEPPEENLHTLNCEQKTEIGSATRLSSSCSRVVDCTSLIESQDVEQRNVAKEGCDSGLSLIRQYLNERIPSLLHQSHNEERQQLSAADKYCDSDIRTNTLRVSDTEGRAGREMTVDRSLSPSVGSRKRRYGQMELYYPTAICTSIQTNADSDGVVNCYANNLDRAHDAHVTCIDLSTQARELPSLARRKSGSPDSSEDEIVKLSICSNFATTNNGHITLTDPNRIPEVATNDQVVSRLPVLNNPDSMLIMSTDRSLQCNVINRPWSNYCERSKRYKYSTTSQKTTEYTNRPSSVSDIRFPSHNISADKGILTEKESTPPPRKSIMTSVHSNSECSNVRCWTDPVYLLVDSLTASGALNYKESLTDQVNKDDQKDKRISRRSSEKIISPLCSSPNAETGNKLNEPLNCVNVDQPIGHYVISSATQNVASDAHLIQWKSDVGIPRKWTTLTANSANVGQKDGRQNHETDYFIGDDHDKTSGDSPRRFDDYLVDVTHNTLSGNCSRVENNICHQSVTSAKNHTHGLSNEERDNNGPTVPPGLGSNRTNEQNDFSSSYDDDTDTSLHQSLSKRTSSDCSNRHDNQDLREAGHWCTERTILVGCQGENEILALRCDPCGITFDDDVIHSIHMGCHSHRHPFVCNICGRQCDNRYAFNTHIVRGHRDSSSIGFCELGHNEQA